MPPPNDGAALPAEVALSGAAPCCSSFSAISSWPWSLVLIACVVVPILSDHGFNVSNVTTDGGADGNRITSSIDVGNYTTLPVDCCVGANVWITGHGYHPLGGGERCDRIAHFSPLLCKTFYGQDVGSSAMHPNKGMFSPMIHSTNVRNYLFNCSLVHRMSLCPLSLLCFHHLEALNHLVCLSILLLGVGN